MDLPEAVGGMYQPHKGNLAGTPIPLTAKAIVDGPIF